MASDNAVNSGQKGSAAEATGPNSQDTECKSELLQAASLTLTRITSRRELEWKLSFSLWTGIVLFSAAFFTEEAQAAAELKQAVLRLLPCVYVSVLAGAAVVQTLIQVGHYNDSASYFAYMERAFPKPAKDQCDGKSCKLTRLLRRTWNNFAWWVAHVGITGFLLWASHEAIGLALKS